MVHIEKDGDSFIFEIKGLHKLWSLKSQLKIPVGHVNSAHVNEENLDWARSLRMPGLSIPGLISAGTYLSKDSTIFCDVTNDRNCIVVELQDEYYTRLIIEVENPPLAIKLLTTK